MWTKYTVEGAVSGAYNYHCLVTFFYKGFVTIFAPKFTGEVTKNHVKFLCDS